MMPAAETDAQRLKRRMEEEWNRPLTLFNGRCGRPARWLPPEEMRKRVIPGRNYGGYELKSDDDV